MSDSPGSIRFSLRAVLGLFILSAVGLQLLLRNGWIASALGVSALLAFHRVWAVPGRWQKALSLVIGAAALWHLGFHWSDRLYVCTKCLSDRWTTYYETPFFGPAEIADDLRETIRALTTERLGFACEHDFQEWPGWRIDHWGLWFDQFRDSEGMLWGESDRQEFDIVIAPYVDQIRADHPEAIAALKKQLEGPDHEKAWIDFNVKYLRSEAIRLLEEYRKQLEAQEAADEHDDATSK